MELQSLYELKERLERAAVAGAGLLDEDFRLKRAAEGLEPLAKASPVFGKIKAGAESLLAAPREERPGKLLALLALVDAVVYTQGAVGKAGDLLPLYCGGSGVYRTLSRGALSPLLTALTTTGSGRMEIVQSAWENHPEYFEDFRVLPALVAGLGDSYGELAALNGEILKKLGGAPLPLLKRDFDPAGKKEMARRVEVIAALQGPQATPWLREILPQAKKEVRGAVITALGDDQDNAALLLELAKTERGANRDAALQALALQEGAEVRSFWEEELAKNSQSVKFLQPARSDWSVDLITAGLRQRLETLLTREGPASLAESQDITAWCWAIGQKDSPVMLDFWRWVDEHIEAIDRIEDEKGRSPFLGVRLTDHLRDILLKTGPGPLRDFCQTLWENRPAMTRYLILSFLAALLSRPAAEVYDRFSPYLLTKKPLLDAGPKRAIHDVLLRAFTWVTWRKDQKSYWVKEDDRPFYNWDNVWDYITGQPTAEPLDPRWIPRLIQAVWKEIPGQYMPFGSGDPVGRFDLALASLIDHENEEMRSAAGTYLRGAMLSSGNAYVYGRFLVDLGENPRGVLGRSLRKKSGRHYLYQMWELLFAAAARFPAQEVAELMEEIDPALAFRKNDLPLAEKVIPWTIQQLREGKPFPVWAEWWSMR